MRIHQETGIGSDIICVPMKMCLLIRDGKPLTFAVPRGPGGPIERCFEGDISWKAAFAWISLKLKSNWKAWEETAGQTKAGNAVRTLQSGSGYPYAIIRNSSPS